MARDDIADAAVAVLLERRRRTTARRTPDRTGGAYASTRSRELEPRRAGTRSRTTPETLDGGLRVAGPYGAPDWMVEGWVTSYAAAATGELDW